MATKTRPKPPTGPNPALARPPRNLLPAVIGGGVALVVVIAALVIFLVTRDGDAQGSSPAVAEQMAVTISGESLPPYSSAASFDNAIGLPAPTLLGSAFDGSPLAVRPGGNPTLVVFLAHWCPACNEEVPHLVEWHNSGRVPENLEVIGVSTSVRVGAANYPPSRWVERRQWPWPVMADSEFSQAGSAYGVTGFPTSVIIGSDGTVLDRVSGVLGLENFESFVLTALARDLPPG